MVLRAEEDVESRNAPVSARALTGSQIASALDHAGPAFHTPRARSHTERARRRSNGCIRLRGRSADGSRDGSSAGLASISRILLKWGASAWIRITAPGRTLQFQPVSDCSRGCLGGDCAGIATALPLW